MKKFTSLLLALCLMLLCAAAAETAGSDITIEDLIAANVPETLFARHESVITRSEVEGAEPFVVFFAREYCFIPEIHYMIDETDGWYCDDRDGEHCLDKYWYAMSDEEKEAYADRFENYQPLVNVETTALETIQGVEDNGDGTLTVTSLLSPEDIAAVYASNGIEMTEELEGVSQQYVYTVDAQTLEIQSYVEKELRGDEVLSSMDVTVEFDAPVPEEAAWMREQIEAYRAGGSGETRTITVIYDSGTEQEQTYTLTMDNMVRLIVIPRDGYNGTYLDAEKTQVYEGGDGVSDMTIYAFAE